MEQQPRLLYRPSRPSPLASCSYNAHSSSPTAATPAFGWSSSSSNFGDMASSSSPTRSTYSFAYPDTLLSGREPDSPPWRSTPSSSTKRSLQYKSTTSIRTSSSTSHTNATTPPTPLASGTRWHDQFTQRCKQRAKQERSKAVNERRNGFAGDYISLDRESKEELAVLRKLAMAEQQAMEEINNGHLTQQARDPRLYSEAEVHHNMLYAIDESALEDGKSKPGRKTDGLR